MSGKIEMPSKGAKIANIALLSCMALFWIIWLAGIAATQDACAKGKIEDLEATIFYKISRNGGFDQTGFDVGVCSNEVSLEWFTLFFQLFCFICAAILTACMTSMYRWEHATIMLFCIATTMGIITAPKSTQEAMRWVQSSSLYAHGREAAAAGNIACVILNYLWIIMFTDKEPKWRPTRNLLSAGVSSLSAAPTYQMQPVATSFTSPQFQPPSAGGVTKGGAPYYAARAVQRY